MKKKWTHKRRDDIVGGELGLRAEMIRSSYRGTIKKLQSAGKCTTGEHINDIEMAEARVAVHRHIRRVY